MSRKTQELKIDGLPVEDAKNPITINISQLDIPRSKAKNPEACVAANACKRVLGAEEARVHLSRVFLRMPGAKKWLRLKTPAALRGEIIAYDRGGRFATGEYKLDPLSASDKPAYHRKRNDKRARHDLGKKTGKKRRKMHFVEGVRDNGHCELGA